MSLELRRLARHLLMTRWHIGQVFPRASMDAIEDAIRASETVHSGQIRFVVEGALHPAAVLNRQSPRERAVEVFSLLKIWDTEHNNGVLIYLLLADRAVEIVADRGVNAKVPAQEWCNICEAMQHTLRTGDYDKAVLSGIQNITTHLARHFPPGASRSGNELPDRPTVL